MAANHHLLQKVIFEVGLAKQEGAFEIQNRISNVFQSLILREMERLFDARVSSERVISIDKLEIDLGNISLAHLEADIEKAFLQQVENFMAALSAEIDNAVAADDHRQVREVQLRWSNSTQAAIETRITLTDSATSYFERLTQLLLFGVSIPNSGKAGVGTIAELMHKVLELQPAEFSRFVLQNKNKPQLLHRLALNLTIPQLTYLLSLLGCRDAAALPGNIRDTAALLMRLDLKLSTLNLPAALRFHDAARFLWWLLLVKFTRSGIGRTPNVRSYAGAEAGTGTGAETENEAEAGTGTAARNGIGMGTETGTGTGKGQAVPLAVPFRDDRMEDIVAELFFVAEQLSERLLFETGAKVKKAMRAYQFAPAVQSALQQVLLQLNAAALRLKKPAKKRGKGQTIDSPELQQQISPDGHLPSPGNAQKGQAKDSPELRKQRSREGDLASPGNAQKGQAKDSRQLRKQRSPDGDLGSPDNAHADDKNSPIGPPKPRQQVLLKDNSGLLNNSLFTLPGKLAEARNAITGTDEIPGADTGIYINNAGLILLAPFLKPFFTNLGLVQDKDFVSQEARWKACHMLQHACGFLPNEDGSVYGEADMVLNKVLCGLAIQDAIPETYELSTAEKEETETLLKSILHHWTIMSRSSVYALQTTFLQKQGRLSITGKDWELLIERDSAVEILIDRLPWTIGFIKLPWNDYTIATTW